MDNHMKIDDLGPWVEDCATVNMNGKSKEGLTLDGLASQIANAIRCHYNDKTTRNDGILMVAHAVRAYHSRFRKEHKNEMKIRWSEDAFSIQKDLHLEHAIPVACITNVLFYALMHKSSTNLTPQAATELVTKIIERNIHLVWVTKDDHDKLNAKYASSMPPGYDTFPWRDPWARYRESGVKILEPVPTDSLTA
jgi:hypothetical protein